MDETKIAVDFLAKNLEKILKIGKIAFGKADEIIQVNLKTAYTNYLQNTKEKYSKAKSFFIRNEPVDLYSYYVPTGIRCGARRVRVPTFEKCLEFSSRIVLLGSGGSGKSILMRHLFLDCIKSGEYAPILIELRDLNSDGAELEQLIDQALDSFGFKISGDYVKRAKEAGHFCFFLDGYDEVNKSLRDKLVGKITHISKKFSACPIFISSRPDDVFNGIEDFSIFHMSPLDLDAAVSLVRKLPFDQDIKSKFISDLRGRLFLDHESFLSNPLLLSIMLLTYGENAEIPSKLSIFYNQAYEALFQRHDANKGGYSRRRLTTLDIQDFSRIFSVFALQTYEKRIFKMSRTMCLRFIEKSRDSLRKEFHAEDYLGDLLTAACLLVEDGLEVAFSHRSFQEYFVALHISNASPEVQAKLIDRYWQNANVDNVMALLLEINPDLVERELFIPVLERVVNAIGVKKIVGVTHHGKYLKRYYNSFDIQADELLASIRHDHDGELAIIKMAVRHSDLYQYPGPSYFQEKHASLYEEFGDGDGATEYSTSSVQRNPQLLRKISEAGGSFSMNYLRAVKQSLALYKSRHSKTIQKLDELLEIE